MRTIRLLLALVAIVLPVEASAQTSFWAESQNHYVNGGYTPTLDFSATHKMNEKMGVFLWALVNDGWGEAIIGPAFFPNANTEIDLGIGIETDKDAWRTMASFFTSSGKASLLLVGELGGSGYHAKWYSSSKAN